jgi:phosphatidylserine synthase
VTSRARVYANLSTLANAAVGVGAVLYILAGNKSWAMLLIVSGIGFDGLDGLFSRRAPGPPSAFGRFADSIADSVTFGLAPAFLLAVHTDRPVLWQPYSTAAIAIAVVFALCAVGRLVYFTARGFHRSDFLGAPTPQAALGVIVLILLSDVPAFWGTNPTLVLAGSAVVALSMILPIPFPKIRKGSPIRPISTITAVGLTIALLLLQFHLAPGSPPYELAFGASLVTVAGVVLYYLLGPLVALTGPAKGA